ncbi:SagB family peptide dehydrogenase [Natrinema sp. SYSU A 869]|uniref:SagB/ThcOx family dehydrogenase n=1 Tax=Natrinema sp. SYSU A 869 TaxID=2871694 RepID=UPI001CA3D488|nr:SagB family peptide dehydrogenase [Natrinema sp. SYSU A 869]
MPIGTADYHEQTKHSPRSVREGGHGLDFDNKPRPYKEYTDLPAVPIAERIRPPQQPALSTITESTPDGDSRRGRSPDLETVATLCYYAAGITKRIDKQGHSLRFRAAATTGALYHVDLYVVCGDLAGDDEADASTADLEAGVYHFDPRTLSLDVLREGDYRGVLANASGDTGVADAPLSVVATSTWWRNAWKYGDRTFRHAFWDSGTTLANLLAVAHALDHRADIVTGFADRPIVDLLGLEPEREAPLEIVPIGAGDTVPKSDSDPADIESINPDTEPLSPTEKSFPLIHDAWAAGTLESGAAADSWRSGRPAGSIGTRDPGDGERIALEPVDAETASSRPLHRTIRRRGSCREYARESISFRKLSTVLDRAVRGVPMDVGRQGDPPLSFVDPYLIVNGVDGLESGTYQYHPAAGELERLRTGECRSEAGHLALDQRLAADAAVCIYFLTDLAELVDALGDRGYRAAQLEASLTAGRLYLGTYAHRTLGGTGLTFYDDIVTDFFEPRAGGQTPMFLYTMGRPV